MKQNIKNNRKKRERIEYTSTISTLSILTLRKDILKRKLKMRRKGERGKERRRTLSLSLSLFPPLLFSEFSFFIIFFFNDKGNSTCFNILKTLLVFHPLPVETLFRGVACAMLRVAFTGHVSPLPCFLLPPPPPPFPLVCFAYFEAEHLTDENIFLCTRP